MVVIVRVLGGGDWEDFGEVGRCFWVIGEIWCPIVLICWALSPPVL